MVLDDHIDENKQRILRLLDTSDDKAVWQDFVAVSLTSSTLRMCANLTPQSNGMYITDVCKPNIIEEVFKCCQTVTLGFTPAVPCKDATTLFKMAETLQVARALGVTEVQDKVNKAFLNDPPQRLLLRDGSTMTMSPHIFRMCDTLVDLSLDCEDMFVVPVPLDDKEAIQDVIDFCTDIVLGVGNAYSLWIDTLHEWPRERLFAMSNTSDFLNNQCALEVCAKAIARHLTGLKVEEMREFLGIVREDNEGHEAQQQRKNE
jgi:hypothetical protein